MMHPSDNPIEQLVQLLSKLPGLGKRSARRAVLHLVKHRETLMQPLAKALHNVEQNIVVCKSCGNIDSHSPCHVCTDPKRDESTICVVEEVADLWAIERGSIFRGLYHVLGGTLSALEGRGPDELNIASLLGRVEKGTIAEIILATNATVEGQTTAHYITERLKDSGVKISRLAQGVPIGGELDYLDDGTLGAALLARQPF